MEVGARRGQLYYNSLWDSVLAGRYVPHQTILKSLLIVNSAEVSVSPKSMTVFTRARNIMIKKKKKRNLYRELTFMLNVAWLQECR